MTKKSLFLGVLLLGLGLVSHAQVVETYRQGFEQTGESRTYTVMGNSTTTRPTSLVSVSGSRSIMIEATRGVEQGIILDTVDFSQNPSFQYFVLEFYHMNLIDNAEYPTTNNERHRTGVIEWRLADETTWNRMRGTNYENGDGEEYSLNFAGQSNFDKYSYTEWTAASAPNNTLWKRERFTFGSGLNGVSPARRKVIVRFTTSAAPSNHPQGQAWYIDDIKLTASASQMTSPLITMLNCPDLMDYPTSRSARIECQVSTTVVNGMCPDSVYILYRLGVNAPVEKHTMQMTSYTGGTATNPALMTAQALIPFVGYDTVVSFRIVAKDASSNHNTRTYPAGDDTWVQYRSVRGQTNQRMLVNSPTATCTDFPFPDQASTHRSQFVYSAEEMAAAGYGPGTIMGMSFYTANGSAGSVSNGQHSHFGIKMCNVDENYQVIIPSAASPRFYTDMMKTVYDSSLTLTQNANTTLNINFQDTFFYAGKGVMMQVIYRNEVNGHDVNTPPLALKAINASCQPTLFKSNSQGSDIDPFTNINFNRANDYNDHIRPNVRFMANENVPLIYDCGIAGFVTPNDSVAANASTPNQVTVTLKNYGVAPINQVMLYYQVDGGAVQSYNWTGNLAGNTQVNVTVSTTQMFSAGYHEMRAWVDDTVQSGSGHYRDHEPLNDTCWTRMISCSGPMSGQKQIGGTGADYQTLEQFLYAVSVCGVNGPLHVKLAPGDYVSQVIPSIPGTSMQNYVQFEPLNGQANSVRFTVPASNNTIYHSPILAPLMDLRNTRYVRFSKIKFEASFNNYMQYHARLGINSVGCQFHECEFVEGASQNNPSQTRATALIYSGGADSITVDRCIFHRGAVGVSMIGPAADNLGKGAVITRNTFENQGTNAIDVRNHRAPVVDSNSMNDLLTGAGYLILVQQVHGEARITRNTGLVTSGSACLGVSELFGTSSQPALIANNMFVANDNGSSDVMTTPMFIIGATYTKILHNSVKMYAPSRSGIAAATLGGGEIDHCYFFNNIVASMDTSNFAFSFIPYSGNTNYIGYNIYYSGSFIMNKYDGMNCTNMSQWNAHSSDGTSQNVNPAFLLRYSTDLRSYSQNVKQHGLYFPEVPADIYNTSRNTTSPCVGAFEFASLPYDFEIIGMEEPYSEYCDVPSSAPLRLWIKNSGVNTYVSGPGSVLTLYYSRSARPGVGTVSSVIITDTIPGNSIVLCDVNRTLSFPVVGQEDTTYNFCFWLSSALDYNMMNDSSMYTVTARYHSPAPSPITMTSPYGATCTVNATQGIQQWNSNVYNSGRKETSTLYWYDSNDPNATPLFRGNPFTSGVLYADTTFYVRQKRELGLMKITEVQIKNTGEGVTYPQPMWMNNQTQLAVELTNVGDYPAHLLGDTIMTIAVNANNTNSNSSLTKQYIFPDVTVQPGQSMVVQFRAGIAVASSDSSATLGALNTVAPQANANFAILYRDKKGVVDAVAFNNMPPASGSVWTAQNIHNTVWQGQGIPLDATTAGVIRTGWPTNPNSITPSATFWQLADANNVMTLGTPSPELVRFTDNGCIGEAAPVTITLTNLPSVDITLDSLVMPEGCDLDQEVVSIGVNNYGSMATGPFAIHYSVDGTLVCTDTIANLPGRDRMTHTFSQPANMYVANGYHRFNFRVWVDHLATDIIAFNDTTLGSFVSSYTPQAPSIRTYDTVDYATRLDLTTLATPVDTLRWYDRDMNALATTNVYTTPFLYNDDTFYVAAVAPMPNDIHVGDLASLNTYNSYPSPLNPNKVNGQEQYLYTAADLIAAGHQAGPITGISFYLDTIRNTTHSMTFTNYKVSIGATNITAFSSTVRWQPLTQVCHLQDFTLTQANKGWVRFEFDQPFMWDGQSNIIVGVIRQLGAAISQGAQTRYTATTGVNTVYHKNDANAVTLTDTPGNGTLSVNRPDIQFEFQDPIGCEGPTSPTYIHVVGIPPLDAALTWPVEYDDPNFSFSSCGPVNFDVMLGNGGNDTLHNVQIDYWVDGVHGVFNSTTAVAPRTSARITVAMPNFQPGRHILKAIVAAPNDTVHVNDTVERMVNVSFCAGTYHIGPASYNDYPSFAVALDTLYGAGVDGPVVFAVQSGTYTEQLTIGSIRGTSLTNTVTFQSATEDADDVRLTYTSITAANNYVLKVDGAENVRFRKMTIYAKGPAASSTAVQVANCSNIRFIGSTIKVLGTINNVNSSCLVVNENVHNLYIDSSILDSGYYSVRSMVSAQGLSDGFYFTESEFRNFWFQGITMRRVGEVYIRHNQITSGVSISSRALTGITLGQTYDGLDIERNNIVLYDEKNGGKRPIVVTNYMGNNTDRGRIYNNMCVAHGTGGNGQVSQGITLDTVQFINVYFNTVRVWAGANAATTRSFSVDNNSTSVFVLNNIFTNFSRGYAYWLKSLQNVATSNYNIFYSDTMALGSNTTYRLAKIGNNELVDIDTLRTLTGKEGNSRYDLTYFVAPNDLHLAFGLYNNTALYLPDVVNDIDGVSRPAIPSPCVGAHEFEREYHDVAIMQFMEPTLANDPNPIEGDTLRVVVKLFNNGSSTETNLWWTSNIVGRTDLSSPRRTISEMQPGEIVYDTSYILLPMGLIDTQRVVAYFSTDMHNDSVLWNNTTDTVFFIDMAYDFCMTGGNNDIVVTTDVGYGEGCRLSNAPVSITLTNKGRKPIPTTYPITIGYEVRLPSTVNYTVPQLPLVHEEQVYLTDPLDVNVSVVIPFQQGVNIYPTDNARDISVRIRGWVSYQYDQKHTGTASRDTTNTDVRPNASSHPENNWTSVTSKYTPAAPVGVDLHIPYGTWDTIRATQGEVYPPTPAARPIRWYRDSTDENSCFYSPTNYNQSTWWETPQYYNDSVYYLACISASNCTSYYNPVHVYLNNRVPVDVAVAGENFLDNDNQQISTVYTPARSTTYMTDDTVKVWLTNYGAQPQSNFPVHYDLYSQQGNQARQLLQSVTETCTHTLQPDEFYLFKFDSLAIIPSENLRYWLNIWTDHPNDNIRSNDTLRTLYEFAPLSEATAYYTQSYEPIVEVYNGIDIVHVSYSSLNHDMPEVGRTYNDLGRIGDPHNPLTPEVPVLRLTKGTTDTLIVEVANSENPADIGTPARLTVMIDYNRDGCFRIPQWSDGGYARECILTDTIYTRIPKKFVYTIPDSACLGYTRMRLIASESIDSFKYTLGDDSRWKTKLTAGNIQDYILYIEDNPVETDVALSRLVSPTDHVLRGTVEDSTTVTLLLSNKGANAVSQVEFGYHIVHNGNVTNHTHTWHGNLEPGHSEPVSLPARSLDFGTHTYTVWINVLDDTLSHNDTLRFEFHRFDTSTLVFFDNFETDRGWWAPTGFNDYTRNVWQRGQTAKPRLNSFVSDSNVLGTNLQGYVNTQRRGNLSYIYTPLFNQSQIKPDTIAFWLATHLSDSNEVWIEYLDYTGRWRLLGTGNDTLWYTAGRAFIGNTPNNSFTSVRYPSGLISDDFPQEFQFRIVYRARESAVACDGAVIDDFKIGRRQRSIDVGVIAITHPTEPQFGQTIYPKVAIKNYGYDTIRNVSLAYHTLGLPLPNVGTYDGSIAPGETKLYQFPDPFVVMSYFPDTFQICAFTTVNSDIYWENDSTCKDFALTPLDNDMGITDFLYPLNHVVAGDSITVTVRLRNYGMQPVSNVNVSYRYNNNLFTENVDFEAILGHPLETFEYVPYTFQGKCRATMGQMNFKAWVSLPGDDYIYNDTVTRQVQGISAIRDLAAECVVVDPAITQEPATYFQVAVRNVGALAVDQYDVWVYYDGDTSTMQHKHIVCDPPFAALTTQYITFGPYENRPNNPYPVVCGFVHCDNDNDLSNDTTTLRENVYKDLAAIKVQIQENRYDECQFRLVIQNIGTTAHTSRLRVKGYLQGVNIPSTIFEPNNFQPGETYNLLFDRTIPKDPNRQYSGNLAFDEYTDANDANNQTTLIEVVNYFEGIPTANNPYEISLEQNYPNPYDHSTRIDFHLPMDADVRFFVMDLMGRLVYQSERHYTEGDHSIPFAQEGLATGVYYYGIQVGDTRLMRKMVHKQ